MTTPDTSPKCYDCGRPYGEPGFPDLVIPHDVWNKISPTGNEGGLLCPSCICAALENAGIETSGKFTSGPLADSNVQKMHTTQGGAICKICIKAPKSTRAQRNDLRKKRKMRRVA